MGDHLVGNVKTFETCIENDGYINKYGKYLERERRPPRAWWKNHILLNMAQIMANVACFDHYLKFLPNLSPLDVSSQ